jgi:2-phosphosulfolactate phosphatase
VLDVAFTRADVRPADVAVVIDVLRATSTITQALAAGYRQVICCDSIERAGSMRGNGRVLAGEKDFMPVEGFDLGNSPGAFAEPRGAEVVLATTNGSPTIVAATECADEVLLGSLLNLDAVAEAVAGACEVTLVCSGTDGRLSLEDAYGAGRLVARLEGERSDAALAAECIAAYYGEPMEALNAGVDAAALRETGQEEDIAWCARESVLDVVPWVTRVEDGVAYVAR